MPDIEKVLAEKTHKDQGLTIHERVFYTLTDQEKLAAHRNAKLLSLLVEHLANKGRISEGDIDGMLLEVIN